MTVVLMKHGDGGGDGVMLEILMLKVKIKGATCGWLPVKQITLLGIVIFPLYIKLNPT
jgi:hypothetical protein